MRYLYNFANLLVLIIITFRFFMIIKTHICVYRDIIIILKIIKNMPQIRTLNSCAFDNIGIYEYIYIYIIRFAC